MSPRESRTLSIAIAKPPKAVYDFVFDLGNMPKWAKTFVKSARKAGDGWTIETPQGPITMRIAPRNELGVLDHTVIAGGAEVYVPMRVVANGAGSEVVFTLFRQPGMTDEAFRKDQRMVETDLKTLKEVLEGK